MTRFVLWFTATLATLNYMTYSHQHHAEVSSWTILFFAFAVVSMFSSPWRLLWRCLSRLAATKWHPATGHMSRSTCRNQFSRNQPRWD